MPNYSLKQILSVIADNEGKRRLVFNSAPLGGIGSMSVYFLIASLPVIEYGILFNDYVFQKLGIATAVIAYIVFLSTTMMVVFGITWLYNNKLIKKINTSWAFYFPNVELNMIIGSGRTPYSHFFDYFSEGKKTINSDDELESLINSCIARIQEENSDLLSAMETSKR